MVTLGWKTYDNSKYFFMLKEAMQFQFIRLSFSQKHDVVKENGVNAQHKNIGANNQTYSST